MGNRASWVGQRCLQVPGTTAEAGAAAGAAAGVAGDPCSTAAHAGLPETGTFLFLMILLLPCGRQVAAATAAVSGKLFLSYSFSWRIGQLFDGTALFKTSFHFSRLSFACFSFFS